MIDAAIVGLGRWGRTFVETVEGRSSRIRFVRAVEAVPEPAREFCAKHGLPLGASLAEALADPEVQAVVLATPHSLHHDQVIACAEAGKPVFCEKPLALTLAEARRMVAACERARVPLGAGHNRRFWASMTELRRIAAAGELGEILHVEGHNSNENSNKVLDGWRLSPAESPGGGMTGAGLHALDGMISLRGPVRWVHARLTERRAGPPAIDTLSVLLEFADRTSGTLATIRATPFFWRVHVFGTRGSAEVLAETELVLRRSGAAPERLRLEPVDSVRAELEAFADAVEGRAPYPITPREMLMTVAAFDAIVRSIERGGPVEVETVSS
jgi:predicted dehydrogenase